MKIRYAEDADALYIRLKDGRIDHSDEIPEGIIVDFDEAGNIVAIKILDASKRTDISQLLIQSFKKVEVVSTSRIDSVRFCSPICVGSSPLFGVSSIQFLNRTALRFITL